MAHRSEDGQVRDASAAYALWDDLFDECLRLALSGDDPAERAAARERLARGLARSFAERDAMWERLLAAGAPAHGG